MLWGCLGALAFVGFATACDTAETGPPPASEIGSGGGGSVSAVDATLPPTGGTDLTGDASVLDAGALDTDAGDGSTDGMDATVFVDPEFEFYSGPRDLRETGYFAAGTSGPAAALTPYTPRFALWSDGATKARYVLLPDGAQIDSTDPDRWVFPVGTKAFKDFYQVSPTSGQRIHLETRLLEKRPEGWRAMSFLWNAEQTGATAVPWGRQDVLGTDHDVPSDEACAGCHEGAQDWLLGLDVFQLGYDAPAPGHLTLAQLRTNGRLSQDPGADRFDPPGDVVAAAALGMLHVNCGSCHQPGTLAFERTDLHLRLMVGEVGAVEDTGAFRTTVGVPNQKRLDGWPLRIEAGAPERSAMVERMRSRVRQVAMPPLGSERPDDAGLAQLRAWIESL